MKRLLYFLSFITSFSYAQELVRDINKTSLSQPSYSTGNCFSCGGKIYLGARDGEHGRELWITDGTEGGTRLIKDLEEGLLSGFFTAPTCRNGKLYFGGNGLWTTDGTAEGTTNVFPYDINGHAIVDDELIIVGPDATVYSANTDGSNLEIVKAFPLNSSIGLFATSTQLFFVVRLFNSNYTETGTQVWVYRDGSIGMVYEKEGEFAVNAQALFGERLLWQVSPGEIWISDGTQEGTMFLKDDLYLYAGNGSVPTIGGSALLLRNGGFETWATDGTPEGTVKIIDDFQVYNAIEYNNKYYFVARASNDMGDRIIRTDLDFSNTETFVESSAYPYSGVLLGIINDKLILGSQFENKGTELVATDGTTKTLIKDINKGTGSSSPQSFVAVDGGGIFLADDGENGLEFWVTDGTSAGTHLIKNIAAGTEGTGVSNTYFYNGKLYFYALTDSLDLFGPQLWKSDGTASGTTLVNQGTGYYGLMMGTGKYLVSEGFQKTDLETGEQSLFYNLYADYSGSGYSSNMKGIAVGNDIYFNAYFFPKSTGISTGNELWRVNPVTNEFALTKDINPGFESSIYYGDPQGAILSGKFFFAATAYGSDFEPWVTNGTEAGTFLLKDIAPEGGSYPAGFTSMSNKVYFVAASPVRRQIWVTDGTTGGTHLLKEQGELGGVISNGFGVLGNKLIYGWTPGDATAEIWSTDGTANGSSKIIALPGLPSVVSDFTTVGNKVLFVVDNQELWVTDGTADGTKELEFESAGAIYFPFPSVVKDGVMYFYLSQRFWRTDGTKVELIGSGDPTTNFSVNDNYLLFFQEHPTYGRELFRYDLSEISGVGSEEEVKQVPIIYPNPASHTLYVKTKTPTSLRIVDMSGREKYSQLINEDTGVDISSYADGMYVVILNDRQFKFIKRH